MANMVDYLLWRGDIPFSVDPFNEVDNIILSELAYTDFNGIVPGPMVGESVTIQYACNAFFEKYADDEIMAKNSSTKVAPFLMRHLVESKRFGDMRLTGYVNDVDTEYQSQFSVVTFLLGDGTSFVAYRGTDNTIVGWKEDFNMSFLYQTAGQIAAASYLNDNFRGKDENIRVGGHSKGGNFAVYASSFCDVSIQNRILQVYSNDGPGFCKEITAAEEYQRILPKVVSTIPESSIVGMMLENELEHNIVKSTQVGAMQHDCMSWEVLGNHFVLVENMNEASIKLDKTLKNWVYGMEPETREEFVNIMFDAISATGVTTLDELTSSKLSMINEITKHLTGLPKDKQKALKDVLLRFAYSGGETLAGNMQSKFTKLPSGENGILPRMKK